MSLDKKYVMWALSFAAAGLALGIYMAASRIIRSWWLMPTSY
jgi:hypothetical protein